MTRDSPVARAMLAIGSPSVFIRRTRVSCSRVTLTGVRIPAGLPMCLPRPGPLPDRRDSLGANLRLVCGHRCQPVRHEAAGGGREVQSILETDQVDLAGHKVFKERRQSLGGPSQSVEAPASQLANLAGLDVLCQLVHPGDPSSCR